MMHDDNSGHHHHCCGNDKDSKHEHKHNWDEYMKGMDKEELMMKKEKLEKKLAMINKLLEDKK